MRRLFDGKRKVCVNNIGASRWIFGTYHISHGPHAINLSLGVCKQHRTRPACASAQSDQHLCYSLFEVSYVNLLQVVLHQISVLSSQVRLATQE